MVELTSNAISEVKRLLEKEAKKDLGLRVGIEKGGCSGYSYKLDFDQAKSDDQIREYDGVKVIVDSESLSYLEGTTIDFVDGLEGRGFKFMNPRAKKSCGCGESFSV